MNLVTGGTGYITEGQIVLSPELDRRGIYPPIDALGSLSRLMRLAAGPGQTRDDHLDIAAQLYGLVARARQVADLAEIIVSPRPAAPGGALTRAHAGPAHARGMLPLPGSHRESRSFR